jgi:D-alanyl-D-alanine carboxypeptidase/D-alanyl-D-alanine-endopeptidase (penicillin-binding protein 4)
VPEGDGSHVATPAGDGRRRRDGRWLRRSTATFVVLVLVAAGASFQLDLGNRWFGFDYPSPVTQPAEVLPPAGLTLPAARPVAAVAAPTSEGSVDREAVRRALAKLLADKRLGRHVAVDVGQLSDGAVVFRHGARKVTPASTLKMLTATAVLEALGPDHRFTTRVVATPSSPRIFLVGGGDPLLGRDASDPDGTYPARADLDTLARATAKALRGLGRSRVRLSYDASLFTGPSVNPRWEPSYIPDNVVSPISALWVDEGRDRPGFGYRSADPAAAAGEVFAQALRKRGIAVSGRATAAIAPAEADGGEDIASVQGAPLSEVVQHVLEVSDNEGAEVLLRQVALAEQQPASFVGGTRAVRAVLTRLGVDLAGDRILDGSGLSRQDLLTPETLLAVIAVASGADHPGLRSVVADLPVAGFTGSLAYRFQSGDRSGLGLVRAKTGTLTGVHGLTGTVTSVDGAVMSFVAIADKVKLANTLAARSLLDQMSAALAGCTCAATEPTG